MNYFLVVRIFYGIAIFVMVFGAIPVETKAASVIITPSVPPVVAQGQVFRFSANTPVVWSLSTGSAGSIDPDGTYRAPERVVPKQQAAGCQIFSNDYIFNTKVESLPKHAQSDSWIGKIQARNGRLSYLYSFPLNIVDNSVPVRNHHFLYNPSMDGTYWYPSLPDRRYQSGEYSTVEADHHLLSINKENCLAQETYGETNNYAAGNCPTCTAASGNKYDTMQSGLISGGGTDASGIPIYPTVLRVEEIERALASGGSIQHMLRFTLSNSLIKPEHVWPATANAYPWGDIPYGTVIRLKPSFSFNSSNPVTALLVKQLKEYGLILGDGGIDLQVGVDDNIQVPPLISEAFRELFVAGIGGGNFEVVDTSPLMDSQLSGLVKLGNGYVNPTDFAEVVATDPVTGQIAKQRVVLRSVTVGVESPRAFIQAGSAGKQLEAWVNGTANKNLTWSMSPAIAGASISSSGFFVPPASLNAPVLTSVTAVSSADSSAQARIIVAILPSGTLRLAAGGANYTDAAGNTWWSKANLGGVDYWVNGFDSGHNYNSTKLSFTDATLYSQGHFGNSDFKIDLAVLNGTYKLTARMTESQNCTGASCIQNLEVNGNIIHRDVHLYNLAGGFNLPLDLDLPVQVTDGNIQFAVRGRMPFGFHSKLSALKIEKVTTTPYITISSPSSEPMTIGQQRQLTAVGWYMGNSVTWTVESGPGTVSANGLYTASNVSSSANAVVKATSTSDPTKTATITIPLVLGTMTVAPSVAKVHRGLSQQFSATINGIQYSNVLWTASVGTISSSGLYTAPSAVAADEVVTVTASDVANPSRKAETKFTVPALAEPIRIQSGTICSPGTFTDAQNRTWVKDYGFGGDVMTGYRDDSAVFQGTTTDMYPLYRCERAVTGNKNFYYEFNLPTGNYLVTLKWAEYRPANQANPYKMTVKIQNEVVLTDFNPITAAGGVGKIYDKTFSAQVANGKLRIDFTGKDTGVWGYSAGVSGLEIIPVSVIPSDVIPPVLSLVSATTTASTATITWTTNEAADTQVEYGTSVSYGSSSTLADTGAGMRTSHSVSLSGLTAGTSYQYRVKSRDAAGNLSISSNGSFTTSGGTPAPTPTPSPKPSPVVSTIRRKIKLNMEGVANKVAPGSVTFLNPVTRNAVAIQSFTTDINGEYEFYLPSNLPSGAVLRVNVQGYLPRLVTGADLTTVSLVTINIPALPAGDLNGDGVINSLDYSGMNRKWSQTSALGVFDINRDGKVDISDYQIMRSNFYKSGE